MRVQKLTSHVSSLACPHCDAPRAEPMQGMQPSPSRRQVLPNKPLPAPPPRVAVLSGRDADSGASQRAAKSASVDANCEPLLSARTEAMSLHVHQRVGSDRSPRTFITAPPRSDSSPNIRGLRVDSTRAEISSQLPDLAPEQQEDELLEELLGVLQNEEALAVIEGRIRDAAQRQGHSGRLRSGTSAHGCHRWLIFFVVADNEAMRFEKVRTAFL